MQPQPPGPLATVEIELSFFFMMWILYLITPWISINGQAERRPWGKHVFQLAPGRYHIEAWYPYLFRSRTSPGAIALDVAPGGSYRLRYRPAWLVFLPGSIKLVSGPALPPATARALPVIRYLHSMIRVRDLDAALRFFCQGLGLSEIRRRDHEAGRFTLVFLGTDPDADSPQVELTHNWDNDAAYGGGRNFGHLAYEVDDVYATCHHLMALGYTISRPPRDGRMAFIRSPDLISVELLQRGAALAPAEPWTSMANVGEW